MIVGKSPYSSYPDPFASESDKRKPEFGMAFAEYIGRYWWSGGTITSSSKYGSRREEIRRINTYKRGDVDPRQFANLLEIDADVSSKAFDTQVLSTAPKYINIAVDNVAESVFGIQVQGTDRHASELKEGAKDKIREEMLFQQYAKQFEEASGIAFETVEDLPETEEELDLIARLDFKTNYEVAAEESIKRVFELNDADELINQCIEDYVCHGEMVMKVAYDNQLGVKIEYIDPEDFISSYNVDKTRDIKNVQYQGAVRTKNIVELERMVGAKLTDAEKKQIKGYQYNGRGSQYEYDRDFTVDILDFAFKATKEDKYKKRWNDRGGYRLTKKDPDWEPPKGREKIKLSDRYDTWYGGIHVIGSRLLFNYGELKYMTRERGEAGRVLAPFIHYRGSTEAIGHRLEPIWKRLHVIHMQMQRITTSLRAGGYAYDIDGMTSIDVGNGKILKPHNIIKIHNESGNFYYSGSTMGDDQVRIPISPIAATDISSLNELITQWNHYINEANSAIGYNEYSLGTASLKGVLSSTEQAARAATTTSTKHIFNGWYSFMRNLADSVVCRIQDAFLYGNTNALIAPLIGKLNLQELQGSYFIHKAQFMSIVKIKPTQQEKEVIMRRLEQAVQNGSLEPDDAARVELEIDNPQRMAQVMSSLKRKRRKEMQRAEEQKAAQEMQAIQMKSQAERQQKLEEIQAKMQAEIQVESVKQRGDVNKITYEWENKFQYLQMEKKYDLMAAEIRGNVEMTKEEKKDLRAMKEADAQSAIAAQKASNPLGTTNLEERERIKKQMEQ